MTGIEVDTAALALLAERIRRSAVEAHAVAADPGPLFTAIDALAVPALVEAARVFVQAWGSALADIVDDAHRLADAIDLVSVGYQHAESDLSGGVFR
jgi:hypothetical protein